MSDNIDKRVVAVLLVIAVVLSVVATWKVLTTQPKVTVVGAPQGAEVSLTVLSEKALQPAGALSSAGGSSVSLNVGENK